MALARIIAAAAYAVLNPAVQAEYKQVGEEYHLDVVGEDFSHVVQKKTIAEEHRKKAETKAEELQNQLDEIRRGNIPKADVEALENSHKERYNKAVKEAKEREAVLLGNISRVMVEGRAMALAKELSTAPDLLAPVIASRMQAVEGENGFELKVKDKAGVLGVMSLDDLTNEIKGDARYASVLIGSKGSGGGAGGAGGAGGGTGGGKKLADMNDVERTEFYRRDPEGFRRAVAAQRAAS